MVRTSFEHIVDLIIASNNNSTYQQYLCMHFKNMDKVDCYGSNVSCSIISSLFSPSSTSPPSTPSGVATTEVVAAETRLYRARLILENHLYDELLNKYQLAITRLSELAREATALQEDNDWLRLANDDLTRRLNDLLSWSERPRLYTPSDWSTSSSDQNVVGVKIGNDIVGSNSPTSVINDHEERFTLPRSISIRSPGSFNPSSPAPALNHSPSASQHVMNVATVKVQREEKAAEMEVYNQGMYKTELCNKWQQTGTCPYDDHCQFAHGLSELRPVIRHPRYKTQVCRMVLAGGTCPYGHRCHFRHALSVTTRLS